MASKPHHARDGAAPPPPDPALTPAPPTDVVPHRLERGMLIVPQDTPLADCPTSLDLSTEEGRCALLNALNAPDLTFDGNGQVEIAVAHYVAHPASRVDEVTAEVSEYSRLVLIDPDGRRYSTSSPVVAHRLAQALRLFGPGPFRPPLPCVIRQVRSRKSGRTYHELEVLPRAGHYPPTPTGTPATPAVCAGVVPPLRLVARSAVDARPHAGRPGLPEMRLRRDGRVERPLPAGRLPPGHARLGGQAIALNQATRVTLAQTLYHQRELGHSEERAVAYVTARFPGMTQADLRWARDQLARAETATYRLGLWTEQATVGRREGAGYKIGTEGETDPHRRLREALAGTQPPASNVGVRVELITTRPDGSLQPISVYLNMTWDSTIQDVVDAAAQAAADIIAQGSQVEYRGFRYAGPTRWPAPAQF